MSSVLTRAAELASSRASITPQIVLEIEGVPTLFGVVVIEKYIRIGDPGLEIGNDWVIGGVSEVENQNACVDLGGSSSKIQQQLEPDKGSVSSISSVQVSLIDFAGSISEMISPGFVLGDILATKAKLKMGFLGTGYPDDYITIFSGVIDDIDSGAGAIKLNIAHPEQKKRQKIFPKLETKLSGAINSAVTTIPVNSTEGFRKPYADTPTALVDSSLSYCVRIDDEIVEYSDFNGTNFLTCTRGVHGTQAAAHDSGAGVESVYVLEGPGIDLALKVMLSGKNGPWVEDVEAESFVAVTGNPDVADSIFFQGVDLPDVYGVTQGDFISITGAANGANNVTLKEISGVNKIDGGTYLLINGVSFVRETDTAAVVSFRSRFDVYGYGLGLDPDQVDIEEHIFINDLILSAGSSLRFLINEAIDGKEFLDKEIYAPLGAYSIPRKGRCSIGYHLGPLPRNAVPIITKDKIKNPSKIRLKRTINKNFYNTVIYQLDNDLINDKFRAGFVYYDQDSRNRIDAGDRALTFKSLGMRTDLSAAILTDRISKRLLNRYRFGAEFFTGLEIFFSAGFNVEPGDLVVLDFSDLQVTNTLSGKRDRSAKIYEVVNRSMDLKTGSVTIDVIDTNFDMSERYGVISPSSKLDAGCTTTELYVKDSFGELYPNDEGRKWIQYEGLPLRVHSADFSFDEETTLIAIDPANRAHFTVSPALPSAPPADYIIDIADFPATTDPKDSELYKLFHAFLSPAVAIASGVSGFAFNVAAPDAAKFLPGAVVLVRSETWGVMSAENKVASVAGTLVTLENDLGFTPSAGYIAEYIGFSDGSAAYRYV